MKKNGAEQTLPTLGLTNNQLFFLGFAQVSSLGKSQTQAQSASLMSRSSEIRKATFLKLRNPQFIGPTTGHLPRKKASLRVPWWSRG